MTASIHRQACACAVLDVQPSWPSRGLHLQGAPDCHHKWLVYVTTLWGGLLYNNRSLKQGECSLHGYDNYFQGDKQDFLPLTTALSPPWNSFLNHSIPLLVSWTFHIHKCGSVAAEGKGRSVRQILASIWLSANYFTSFSLGSPICKMGMMGCFPQLQHGCEAPMRT